MNHSLKNKKILFAGLIVLLVLNVAAIGVMIYNLFTIHEKSLLITNIVTLVMALAVLYYGLIGYKGPHGNLLRYLMLMYAVMLGVSVFLNMGISKTVLALSLAAMILVAYAAGRLNKRIGVTIIAILVTALLVAAMIFEQCSPRAIGAPQLPGEPGVQQTIPTDEPPANSPGFGGLAINAARVLLWLSIGDAYLYRFRAHKEAGENE